MERLLSLRPFGADESNRTPLALVPRRGCPAFARDAGRGVVQSCINLLEAVDIERSGEDRFTPGIHPGRGVPVLASEDRGVGRMAQPQDVQSELDGRGCLLDGRVTGPRLVIDDVKGVAATFDPVDPTRSSAPAFAAPEGVWSRARSPIICHCRRAVNETGPDPGAATGASARARSAAQGRAHRAGAQQ